MPTLKKDGVNYTTNKEKAELFGKYLSGVSGNSGNSVTAVILWSSRSANPPLRMSILRSSTEGNCLLTTNLLMSLLTSLLYALLVQV